MQSMVLNMTRPDVMPAWSQAHRMFVTTPEAPLQKLQVIGEFPTWLRGTLIRNSPGGYANGKDEMRHWNDGWAQLHQWEIDGAKGTVTHMSRFMNTSSYRKADEKNAITQTGYGTPSNPGPRPHPTNPTAALDVDSKLSAENAEAESDGLRKPAAGENGLPDIWPFNKFALNPMVNVWKFDSKFMATTDENIFFEFDPDTLETIGDVNGGWSPDDPITKKGEWGIGVAHGRYDRAKGQHFWVEIDLAGFPAPPSRRRDLGALAASSSKPAKYNVWTYQETGFNGTGPLPDRRILGVVEDADTSFVHSFGLTENYIIIIQCPLHYTKSIWQFIFAKEVIDTMSWNASMPTKFHIMHRETGEIVRTFEGSEAFFVYHVLNAFEDEKGDIHISFSRHNDSSLITKGMYLENVVDQPEKYVPTYAQARLASCVIPLSSAAAGELECDILVDKTFEMGTFNFADYHMKPARYAWGASFVDANMPGTNGTSDFIDEIIKVDMAEKRVEASWKAPGVFVCEPLFYPRPNAVLEDDGALVFVGYNSSADHSFLIALNGTSMEELARANMPGRLAANFHGKLCPADEDFCIGL